MEKSVFDPAMQNNDLDSKIVVALERVSEAFKVLLWEQSKNLGLSPIQIQILIFIQMHPGSLCKVSYLAEEFNLSKPTISDAVKALEQKGLVSKITELADTRSYTLELRPEGKVIAEKVSLFSNVLRDSLSMMPASEKNNLWSSLVTIINNLRQSGVISVQRNCQSCQQYALEGGRHYCKLLQQHLETKELRLDCPEHVRVL